MLERLVLHDFAVARQVAIELHAGLNVFTGETGAGKSLIVDALAFVLGARRGRNVIATGAQRATVEATLLLDGQRRVVERAIAASGRSTARIDGQPAPLDALAEIGARVVDIHGQADQLAILRPAVQLAALDAYAGLTAERDAFAAGVRELRGVRRELRDTASGGRERERLLDQLRFEADEIAAAGLLPAEDDALQRERARLANTSRLLEDTAAALAALDAGPIDEAAAAVAAIVQRDPSAEEVAALAETLTAAAGDLRRALRAYRETLDEDPERLAAVEERLDRIARLKRKYGATVDEILAYGREAEERLRALARSDERAAELQAREAELVSSLGAEAEQLSRRRRAAAVALRRDLADELACLGMARAALEVGFAREDDTAGLPVGLPDYELAGEGDTATDSERHPRAFGEAGVDRIEFLASFNPGEAPRPLSAVASGGETSRFLLAVTTVLGAAAEPRIVVFDEVDEGVGGRAGSLVGEALARLARRHQVLCVTHLPQVAAYGARHFVVTKESRDGATWSDVHRVEGSDRLDELAAMLGGRSDATRAAAAELLQAAAAPAAPA